MEHTFLQLGFSRIVLGMPEAALPDAVGKELLLYEIPFIVMGIFVSFAISQLFHQLGGSIPEMQRNRQIPRLADRFQGGVDSFVS